MFNDWIFAYRVYEQFPAMPGASHIAIRPPPSLCAFADLATG